MLEVVRECADLRRWKHLAVRLGGVVDLRGGGVLGGIKILGDEMCESGDGEGDGKRYMFQRVTMRVVGCWRWYVNMQTSGVGNTWRCDWVVWQVCGAVEY